MGQPDVPPLYALKVAHIRIIKESRSPEYSIWSHIHTFFIRFVYLGFLIPSCFFCWSVLNLPSLLLRQLCRTIFTCLYVYTFFSHVLFTFYPSVTSCHVVWLTNVLFFTTDTSWISYSFVFPCCSLQNLMMIVFVVTSYFFLFVW